MIRKILLAYDGSEPESVIQTPHASRMPTASQAGHSLGTGFCMNRPCSRISRT
jgi:hypothetical protein